MTEALFKVLKIQRTRTTSRERPPFHDIYPISSVSDKSLQQTIYRTSRKQPGLRQFVWVRGRSAVRARLVLDCIIALSRLACLVHELCIIYNTVEAKHYS